MKHTIQTGAGRLTIEPTEQYGGVVKVTVKPTIWPEVMFTFKPEEAGLIAQALDLCIHELWEQEHAKASEATL